MQRSKVSVTCLEHRIEMGSLMGPKCRPVNVLEIYSYCYVQYTTHGQELFSDGCSESGISLQQMMECLKLQLGFEIWVNDSNTLREVESTAPLLSELIRRIQTNFPVTQVTVGASPKFIHLQRCCTT